MSSMGLVVCLAELVEACGIFAYLMGSMGSMGFTMNVFLRLCEAGS